MFERPAVKQEKNMALYSESPKLFTTEFNLLKKCLSLVSREFKLYVYGKNGKRQIQDEKFSK